VSAVGGSDADPTWQPHLKEQTQELERIRKGLEAWMRDRLVDPGLAIGGMRPPAGTGVANETVMFDVRRTTGANAGRGEEYVARLATPDSLYLDYDLSLHYRMYETMTAFGSVPTPGVLGYEAGTDAVGAPFFVMEKIDGDIPTDTPSWTTEGFIFDAEPAQRRALWERTVRLMADFHRLDPAPFNFLRTGAADSGLGDSFDYWRRSLRWAEPDGPLPLVQECEEWLLAHQPAGVTSLSWGDSRLPNVIYRDFSPVGMLDWDLVSLAGPQADLAWWIIMDTQGTQPLDGIGSPDDLVDLWEDATGLRATELHWYLVFSAYRLAAILTKLFSMMTAQGHMTAEVARSELERGAHVQQICGLLDLTPPAGIEARVPAVHLDR